MFDKIRFRRFAAIVCFCAAVILCACQKDPQAKKTLPEASDSVNLSFEIFNHTGGFLTAFEKTCRKGSHLTIDYSGLDVKGVDKERIVIRQDRFGELVAFSRTGTASFVAPALDENYTLYLMNASNGADYRLVDTWPDTYEGVLEYVPPLRWYREDRNDFQGPEDVITDAIAQLNDALDYPWATYGSIQRIDGRENDSFGVGYGYCRNQFGWHNPYWAGVNTEHCHTYKMILTTFLEEIFELLTRLDDIGGKDTANLITDPETGNLNEIGKDLLAYVFVKDEKI